MQMILIVVLLAVAAMMIAYSMMPNRRQEEEELKRRMAGRSAHEVPLADRPPDKNVVRKRSGSRLLKKAAMLSRPVMPKSNEEQSTLRIKLANAGFRRESAPSLFLASKTVLAVGLTGLTVMLSWTSGYTLTRVMGLTATLGGIGFMLPNLWLWLAAKQRSEAINNGLPDSLDLMVVSVEAGLGLDAAIQRVADEMRSVHPELAEEWTIATLETQMGVQRTEALESMAERTGVPAMKSLVAVITQAERFGTSIAKALRNQADAIRTKRQQRAEERAQKTAVKLMIPLVLFIFPAIMIVLGGPAGIMFMRQMKDNPNL